MAGKFWSNLLNRRQEVPRNNLGRPPGEGGDPLDIPSEDPRIDAIIIRLQQDGLDRNTLNAKLIAELPPLLQLSTDEEVLAQTEAQRMLNSPQPQRNWTPHMGAATKKLEQGICETLVLEAPKHADAMTIPISQYLELLIKALDKMLSSSRWHAQRNARKLEDLKPPDSNHDLRRQETSATTMDRVFSLMIGAVEYQLSRDQQVNFVNQREDLARRADVSDAQVNAFTEVMLTMRALRVKVAALVQQQSADQQREHVAAAGPSHQVDWPGSGLSLEDVSQAAGRLSARRTSTTVAGEMLLALTRGEQVASGVTAALTESAQELVRVASIATLNRDGGGDLVANGLEMVQLINDWATASGQSGSLYPIVEEIAGERPALWPVIPEQTPVVALAGPALAVGYLWVTDPGQHEPPGGAPTADELIRHAINPKMGRRIAQIQAEKSRTSGSDAE